MSDQPFKCFQYIFLFYKGHLAVNLGKFRLSVRSQIFIPETFDNLEIAVKTTDHQQLLEGLWRLGKRIKLAWVDTAGNNEVPGPLRGTFDQYRCFHFNKVQGILIFSGFLHHSVSEL